MTSLPAAVVVFPGSNGHRDLVEALGAAGFDPVLHPSSEPVPPEAVLAGLPGGFSYGDYWRAGMLASREAAVRSLSGLVARGGLVVGICNGFQILVEAGMLPGALAHNDPAGFRHVWVTLRPTAAAVGPWFSGLSPDARLRLPIAHGEGRYLHPDGFDAVRDLVPLVFEDNPNGSTGDTAALLDDTGRILGVMPHPERASHPDLGSSDGLALFLSAREWLQRQAGSGGERETRPVEPVGRRS
jgi:phosphoribosylformylglycinamidine synthase subunit PurQ / glutaminase